MPGAEPPAERGPVAKGPAAPLPIGSGHHGHRTVVAVLAVAVLVALSIGFIVRGSLSAADSATPATSLPSPTEPATSPPASPPSEQQSGIAVPDIGTHSAHLNDLSTASAPTPVRLEINGLHIDAPVVPVGVADDGSGEMAIPPSPATVAWYRFGPSPGTSGNAVLAGHVDYDSAPGAFFELADLDPGTAVTVAYDDGSSRNFTVTKRQQYTKADLPAADLFRRDGSPGLVLITCGGSFDSEARSYRDNVVIHAVPV